MHKLMQCNSRATGCECLLNVGEPSHSLLFVLLPCCIMFMSVAKESYTPDEQMIKWFHSALNRNML